MKRRLFMAVGMSALLVAAVMPTAASARSPERGALADQLDVLKGRKPNLDALPSRRDPNRMVSVVVELEGRPVTLHQADALAAGRELSEGEKAAVRRPLISRQSSMKTQLRGLGAQVLGSYTDTFNGIKIRVRAGELRRVAQLRGVVGVTPVVIHYADNANTVRYLGADKTWGQTGYTGAGVKLAVIDSGINYYHRNFAGAGGAAMAADDDEVREPGTFPTSKVVKGWDFVGDDYNPSDDDDTNDEPQPDPDPMDCKDPDSPNVQHGTHVAGTAAGTGVRANGTTYTGSYDAQTLNDTNFRIAPGVAPEASLMAYRVFGCDGGTDLTLDAIERAVRDGADVINMSLGSSWGNPSDSSATASNNASMAGVVVVASAGNSGPGAYITGSPAVATRAISVGAMDADPSFPSVWVDVATGDDIRAINANGNTNGLPVTGELNVFEDNPATTCDGDTGEGCEESGTHEDSYIFNAYVPGQIPVTFRGNGARVDRAIQGDAQGAPAVIMVNNSDGFPPFEGPINGADIPFIGVPGADAANLLDDDGESATIRVAPDLPNPNYKHIASFSSGGPGRLNHEVKPDVIAPGVAVFSADGSTATQGKSLGGTSMAAPAVAGVAALVQQAHPNWDTRFIKAAIVGTASPGKIANYEVRKNGSGVPQPLRATRVSGFATTDGAGSLAFGYDEIDESGYSETLKLTLWNKSSSAVTYDLSNQFNGDSRGASVAISPAVVTVPARSNRTVSVTLSFSAADAADMPFAADYLNVDEHGQLFGDVPVASGVVIANPRQTGVGRYNVRVPWLSVPRGVSAVNEGEKDPYTTDGAWRESSIPVKNYGVHGGALDVYAWGIDDGGNEGYNGIDIRAAGVQTLPTEACTGEADADDRCLIFAVNTWSKWNSPSENEFDVLIDVDGDADALAATGYDYAVIGFDIGQVFGVLDGVYGSFIIDLNTGALVNVFLATAPPNSNTMLLPALASDLGLPKTAPVSTAAFEPGPLTDTEFFYHVESFLYADDNPIDFPPFDLATTGNQPSNGTLDARYDAFRPSISNGDFIFLESGERTDLEVRVNANRYKPRQGQKGWMLVTLDDATQDRDADPSQADLVPVGPLP
jgi:minor extracellular serine protease Vpr